MADRGYEGAAVGAALGAGITGYIPVLPVPHSVWALLPVWWVWCRCDGGRCELYHDHGCADCRRTKATVTTDNVAALRQGTSVRKFRPVLKQVTSINTRPVWLKCE